MAERAAWAAASRAMADMQRRDVARVLAVVETDAFSWFLLADTIRLEYDFTLVPESGGR